MPLLFNRFKETAQALSAQNDLKTFSSRPAGGGTKQIQKDTAVYRLIISFVLLGVACFLFWQDPKSQIASGIIGAIISFWLS
jgi:hypothetical protein